MKQSISLTVNGVQRSHEVEPRLMLVHYLREVLGQMLDMPLTPECVENRRRPGGSITASTERA